MRLECLTTTAAVTTWQVTERDFSFPEDFPDVARGLVDQLLVLEADQRLGVAMFPMKRK
jgi:hypothetical protein